MVTCLTVFIPFQLTTSEASDKFWLGGTDFPSDTLFYWWDYNGAIMYGDWTDYDFTNLAANTRNINLVMKWNGKLSISGGGTDTAPAGYICKIQSKYSHLRRRQQQPAGRVHV